VWSIETSCGFESRKIAHLAVPYIQGKCLDLGCGAETVWPSCIGVDNYSTFARTVGIKNDISDLSMFQNASMDAVFSSHAVEDFPRSKVPALLQEWTRVLKVGGYLCLYVPSANLYPKIGESGANPAHKWDIYPGDIEKILRENVMESNGWELLESEERNQADEYSLWIVAKKLERQEWVENVWQRNPGGKKRCLVIRYGAIGDHIVTAAVLPGLKKRGLHITYNTWPNTAKVLELDPHIDEFLLQEENFVADPELVNYWKKLRERYDEVLNFSGSIEGTLLSVPGSSNHNYSTSARRKLYGGTNYLEHTATIADVDFADVNPRFYPSEGELEWAHRVRQTYASPLVCWVLHGSALHKIYPYVHVVAKWLLEQTSCGIVFLGSEDPGKKILYNVISELKKDGVNIDRIVDAVDILDIRKALTVCQVADVVVGPETGLLNSVCYSEDVAKVVFLSHSSATNLTKHWKNTYTLLPDVHCYPCHRLHWSFEFCNFDEKAGSAACASSIDPEDIFDSILAAFAKRSAI
jgi:ADP-heptose:LPS heptosyltransferase/predicted SAM-dependent methyltransferase